MFQEGFLCALRGFRIRLLPVVWSMLHDIVSGNSRLQKMLA